MSAWIEKLRGPVGDGHWEQGGIEQIVIGLPHPLWQQVCDVVDAAAKLEWNLQRSNRPWQARERLRDALLALQADVVAAAPAEEEA